MTSYFDTSAAMKLLVREAETAALRAALAAAQWELTSSWLLHAELYCAAGRRPEVIPADAIEDLLSSVVLVDVRRGDLLAAGAHAPLRANDAIHLATALRLGADELVTYDHELAAAASAAGIRILAPR